MNKREGTLTWDEYFMGLAHLSALRSKDPNTAVGAAIVDGNHKVVSVGYNGFPKGCSDDVFPWDRDGDGLNSKYLYVVHAELNAILNAPRSLQDCTLYVSLFPCNECAKSIIQSGIKRIVYESDKYADTEAMKASRRMLEAAGIELIRIPNTIKLHVEKVPNTSL